MHQVVPGAEFQVRIFWENTLNLGPLTNEELVRTLRDRELTATEQELLERLIAAMDEVDSLTCQTNIGSAATVG